MTSRSSWPAKPTGFRTDVRLFIHRAVIAFIHLGKTGGQTVQSILAGQFGGRHCDVVPWTPLSNPHALVPFDASDARRLLRLYPRLACVSGHHVMPWSDLDTAWERTLWFAFVRDPVARMASAYRQMRRSVPDYMSFEAYCDIETHRDQQCRVLGGAASATQALETIERKDVFIGLQESFDVSLVLLRRTRCPSLSIGYRSRNLTPSRALEVDRLDSDRQRALLEEANREDLVLYETLRDRHERAFAAAADADFDDEVAALRDGRAAVRTDGIRVSRFKRRLVYLPSVALHRAARRVFGGAR